MVVENMFLLLSLAIIRLDKEPFDFFSFFSIRFISVFCQLQRDKFIEMYGKWREMA